MHLVTFQALLKMVPYTCIHGIDIMGVCHFNIWVPHYGDVIMGAIASQITSLNRLFRRRSKKTSKLRVTGLCAGNSPGTGELPAQMASNAKNVSIWWRHHEKCPVFSSSIYSAITGFGCLSVINFYHWCSYHQVFMQLTQDIYLVKKCLRHAQS